VSEANQTFAEVLLQPKQLGVFTDISRKLMLQSDPSAETVVREDILNAVAAKIEDVVIEGGSSNEPTGITQTSGIGSVAGGTNGAAPAWDDITNLVKEVEVDNASISNSTAFLTNSKVKAKLASTAKVSSSDSVNDLGCSVE
jgi:HK97 family phage major capsid protein